MSLHHGIGFALLYFFTQGRLGPDSGYQMDGRAFSYSL